MVTCATCGNTFPPISDIGDRYQQAHGCSAAIYEQDGERYLRGFYGSRVADMKLYKLIPDGKYRLGNACDGCIEDMMTDGLTTLIMEGLW